VKVPLLDLKAQYESIKDDLDRAVSEVVASQQFILGPSVLTCERAVAEYSGCLHAVGVSSGSDALLVCLMGEGIGSGDEVITSAYSFFATAGSVARVGAVPVFVDIRPDSFNLDPSRVESAITSRSRAIIPVHLFGQTADMEAIMSIARRHGLVVIEDAAQAIGAEDGGRRAGSMGDYGCFSFFPSKNLGAFGDGGMVTTNDAARADKLAVLRAHGARPKYHHRLIGGNFRLDAIQAAVVTAKLEHLDRWTARRQDNAARYSRLFTDSGLLAAELVALPKVVAQRHVFNQYVIRVQERDLLQEFLREHGVGTEVYYPVPLHAQECFGHLGYRLGAFPESERAARDTLAIPIYAELTPDQQTYVVDRIRSFYFEARGRRAGRKLAGENTTG
jgi:dTDP-4-amino-4,6-dideoxygalactose transaminase